MRTSCTCSEGIEPCVGASCKQLPGVKAITAPGQPCSVGSGDIAIPTDTTARLAPKDSPGAAVGGDATYEIALWSM